MLPKYKTKKVRTIPLRKYRNEWRKFRNNRNRNHRNLLKVLLIRYSKWNNVVVVFLTLSVPFQIDVADFKSVFEKIKNQYPDGQIVWLRELVQYLNVKIPIDVQDPVFSTKPIGYPLSVVGFYFLSNYIVRFCKHCNI